MSGTLPVVMDSTGLVPQTPDALRANLVALATTMAPGLTTDLPGSLVEDLVSTVVGALVLCDQARVDLVNSVTPYAANPYLLQQLGQQLGMPIGKQSNTSVNVVFTGPPGYTIPPGFLVSDGSYQYAVQDGGTIGSAPTAGAAGSSGTLYAVATTPGVWAVPNGTVTQLATSVPSSVQSSTTPVTVTNPLAGTPGAATQDEEDYRAEVIQGYMAPATGTPTYAKSLLLQVPGVQARLLSVRQSGNAWEVICGGGDPYQVAGAIVRSGLDLSNLVGSTLAVSGITAANPGVVTTNLNHGFTTGQVVNVSGIVGPTSLNNTPLTITVLSENTFSIGVNTSSLPAWAGGGVVTPNLRNQVVTVSDPPDTYTVPFVLPPQETVVLQLVWNTTASNFVAVSAVNTLGTAALTSYVNDVPVGQPMNLFDMQATFRKSVSSLLAPTLIDRMVFTVTINGVSTPPISGTGMIPGDPESYFYAAPGAVILSRG